jgi:hypothetical protein
MHSNRDAKRIDRRRGTPCRRQRVVDPEIHAAYSATNEKTTWERQTSVGFSSDLFAPTHLQSKTIIQIILFLESLSSTKLLECIL